MVLNKNKAQNFQKRTTKIATIFNQQAATATKKKPDSEKSFIATVKIQKQTYTHSYVYKYLAMRVRNIRNPPPFDIQHHLLLSIYTTLH